MAKEKKEQKSNKPAKLEDTRHPEQGSPAAERNDEINTKGKLRKRKGKSLPG